MKKFSTAAAKQIRNVFEQKLTIGLDSGRSLDLLLRVGRSVGSAAGQKLGTTPNAMQEVFGGSASTFFLCRCALAKAGVCANSRARCRLFIKTLQLL
jgi:hypothetical protein